MKMLAFMISLALLYWVMASAARTMMIAAAPAEPAAEGYIAAGGQ